MQGFIRPWLWLHAVFPDTCIWALSAIRGVKTDERQGCGVGEGQWGGEEVVEQNSAWCSPVDWLTKTERAEGEGRRKEREKN